MNEISHKNTNFDCLIGSMQIVDKYFQGSKFDYFSLGCSGILSGQWFFKFLLRRMILNKIYINRTPTLLLSEMSIAALEIVPLPLVRQFFGNSSDFALFLKLASDSGSNSGENYRIAQNVLVRQFFELADLPCIAPCVVTSP